MSLESEENTVKTKETSLADLPSHDNPAIRKNTSFDSPMGFPVQMMQTTNLPEARISVPITLEKILTTKQYILACKTHKIIKDRYGQIDPDCLVHLDFMAFAKQIQNWSEHRTWTDEDFFAILELMFSGKEVSLRIGDQRNAFRAMKLVFDPAIGIESALTYVQAIQTKTTAMDAAKIDWRADDFQLGLVKTLLQGFTDDSIHAALKEGVYASAAGQPKTIDAFMGHLALVMGQKHNSCLDVEKMLGGPIPWGLYHDSSKRLASEEIGITAQALKQKKVKVDSTVKPDLTATATPTKDTSITTKIENTKLKLWCNSCGMQRHLFADCRLRKDHHHPECNPDNSIWWADSREGKRYLNTYPNARCISWELDSVLPGFTGKPKKSKRKYNELTSITSEVEPLVEGIIYIDDHQIYITVLIDTGAMQANYLSLQLEQRLREAGAHQDLNCKCPTIFDACGNIMYEHGRSTCICHTFRVMLQDSNHNDGLIINITAKAISCRYDLIIGLPTIRKYSLTDKFAYLFTNAKTKLTQPVETLCTTVLGKAALNTTSVANLSVRASTEPPTVKSPLIIVDHSALLDYEPDADDRVDEEPHLAEWQEFLCPRRDSQDIPLDILNLVIISGSEEARHDLRVLVEEFRDVFAIELVGPPARLPPMELRVDHSKWYTRANMMPPRIQSLNKETEIRTQIDKLLKFKKIESTQQAYYSQVHLAEKSKSDPPAYRFCIDFRGLNSATEDTAWPLPRIDDMLRRIGQRRPKRMARLDMTWGYWQIMMAEASRKYTAFLVFLGLFQWLCVPFGLKGAPAYFQKCLSSIVLVGLIYNILEVYIDDILVYGQNDKELLDNLRLVFERFRQYNLKLSPKKCELGVSEIEIVGHVINESGITFSRKKTDFVVNFIRPTTQKELKSFLGVATYFHTHIRNFAIIAQPLHALVHDYKPRAFLSWNDQAIQAFEELKLAINNVPTLYFMSNSKKVFLLTDSSDYAIGSYLYQLDDMGKECPIAFVSKSLTPQERRWSTRDKECFAIFFSLVKLQYLLRDIHFTLKTDHQNLTYINLDYKNRVKRWKLTIQEYSFDIEHIPGKDNLIADAFSRLVPDVPAEPTNSTLTSVMLSLSSVDRPSDLEALCLLEELRIPPKEYTIIESVHNAIIGHGGVERTLAKLQTLGHQWRYMREHVRRFIKTCPCCQKLSYLKIPIEANRYTTSTYGVWECLNIDFIGPFPIDEYGNMYILDISCTFSRFTKLSAWPDCSALSAAKGLLQTIGTFGMPSLLRSDNGPAFIAELIKELVYLMGNYHELTLAYSHEENSIVERNNREVERHMRAFIFDDTVLTRWSRSLPLAERILNAEKREILGASPSQIIFGNALNLDRSLLVPTASRESAEVNLSSWMDDMLECQRKLIESAHRLQIMKNIAHLDGTNQNLTEFPIDSYVLVDYEDRPPSKLHTSRRGPLRVINFVGSIYTLLDLVTNKLQDYHVSRLHPFYFDEAHVDPVQVANKDQQMVVVESILDIRGNPRGPRKDISFLVHWRGHDTRDDSWVSYKDLRHNEILHDYLRVHRMRHLIPI